MPAISAQDRLIVALDLPDAAAAEAMVRRLDNTASFFNSDSTRPNLSFATLS